MYSKFLSFQQIDKNKLPVLFIGSLEQHGPFLPLGTDSLIAEKLAEELEKKFSEKILILPTLFYGCSKEHLGFSGTISIEFLSYMSFLKDILSSLISSGFKKILIVTTHGGNNEAGKLIQVDWNYTHQEKIEFINIFDENLKKKVVELFGGYDKHAGSAESSLMAYLYPELVKAGIKEDKSFAVDATGLYKLYSSKELSNTGIFNYSPKVEFNPDKGKKLFEFLVNKLSSSVTHYK